MGMTWEEYKTYREKRKKEEKNKKKQESSNKKSVKQDISQSNQSTVQNNRNSLSNILNNGNNLNFTNNNKNPLLSLQDRKQEAIKQIQDLANSKKNYSNSNNKTSLWDRIKNIAGDIERIDQNIGEGISSGLKDLGGMIFRARQKEVEQRANTTAIPAQILSNSKNDNVRNNAKQQLEIANNMSNKAKENIDNFDTKRMEERAKSQKKIAENISKQSNSVTKKIAELSPSIGNMGVGMVASAVNPIAGAAYFTGSAAGSYYYDAIDRGMTKEQAEKYGMIMGSLEGITEMIGVGNIKKGGKAIKSLASGSGKTALKAATSETVKTGTKEALKNFGIGIADNFMQESIMEPLQELTAQETGGKDKANWENMGKRMLQSGIDGALTSIIMSGAEAGSNTCIGLAEKAEKGQTITQQELQQAVKDAEKVGVDVKKVSEENLLRERDKIINEIQSNKQEENTGNQVVNQETKAPQNRVSQAEAQAKAQINSNLTKVRQFFDENTFNQMKQFIETAPSQEALNQINEDMLSETKSKLEEVYKSEKFTESQSRKQTYAQYQRQNNTKGIEYNNDIVNNALDAVAANRNGRRTVGQWKQVAEQIGLEASDLSKSEIDNIAYGSWFELQPTKNITKYDNRTKEHKGFEKFTSDDWINTIYETAKGQKIQQLDSALSTEQYSLSSPEVQNNYEYKQSDNAKVDVFRRDASNYWDNSEKTTKLVNTIEKVINDKGYNIRLDDTLGENVNGKIVTNQETGEIEITLNPNSSRTGEFLLTHELTHSIETQDMIDIIEQRMSKDAELKNAVEDLKKIYGTEEINSEVLADISGQLFGNQEFINNLSIEKPNVFKRIYDKIVSLANKITGNSSEALFIKDLKNKWEKAYRENTNNIKEEQYSIGGKKGMENAIKNNPQNSLMNYYYNKAQQMAKQNIDNEQIRQQTNWFQDKNGDWKFEFSDKDMALKNNIKLEEGNTYKLGDILEHDTLFEIYPELKDYDVNIKNMKKGSNGAFYRDEHIINLNFNNSKMQKEGSLIHEIQHAIQDIEGFERGRSSRASKLAYYNSLGEIEADNTKQRFLQEKRGNLNRDKVAPESSKLNPQHRKLNNYLENRTVIDKMKDGLYNYLKDKINTKGNNINEDFENYQSKDKENKNKNNALVDGRRNLNENSEKSSFNLSENHKEQQNKIIQENNPMDKTLGEHTWINSTNDIKTYQEAIEEFGGIDNITPDFTAEDVKKALDTGEVTVYSSYPIEQGTFVTPSKMEAQSYAGNEQVYSKNVKLEDVAWIDEIQGQYAQVNKNATTQDNQGRQLSKQQQEYFKDSKAINENGELETVYHGTNKAGFTEFNRNVNYYTNNKAMAQSYTGGTEIVDTKRLESVSDAKSWLKGITDELYIENNAVYDYDGEKILSYDNLEDLMKNLKRDIQNEIGDINAGGTYEGYVNLTNPIEIDANNEIWSMIDVNNISIKGIDNIEQFLKEQGSSVWREKGKLRTSTADIVSAIYDAVEDGRIDADGIIIKNIFDEGGYGNVTPTESGTDYITFNSNQFKAKDNLNPTDNPDIRYSKQNGKWQDYLENNYKSEGTRTDLRDIRLPMKEKQEVKAPIKQTQETTQPTQEKSQNTKGETINWTEIERPENNQKFRKHYKSIIESNQTTAEAKSIAKDLMGTDTYVPETNKGQLAQADQRIMTSSPETELQSLLSRAMNGEKISSVDIAVGERLIQYFSKTGSKQQLQEAIQATAMAGTSAGQTVQALSMLNHQTPQGQATWIQRSVDKMNKELAKKKGGTITTDADGNLQVINKQGVDITDKVDLFNLTPEMVDKIMNSENQEQMYKNIDEVYKELGQQVPKSMLEKVDSWRYFSMLANARTHIRNIVGNQAMGKTQRIKDKLAGGIEDIVSKFNPEMERTKTLKLADKKTKEFAKNDFKNMEVQSRLELNENKYNPQSRLQNARRTFKSNAMENTLGRLFDLNDNLLAAEDGIGLKAGYQKALADYITANKIDVDKITDTQLNKARNYAIQQAKEATFHQANAIASAITQFQNKNNVTKFFVDALLPFKKTPMNVAKAGMEYSPLQIAKSATLDVVNLRKGNISINQYIDNLSKGMTGTGIALAGYALAKAGILKASGGDDKDKEKYDEEQGKQSYSIEIAGKTYSLDWLAPTGIPLFIGAETFKLYNQEDTEKSTEKSSEEDKLNQAIKGASNLLNAGATAINPMSEMSMISGLTSALSSYNTSDNLGSLGNMMTNMGKSYVNQFFPTLMGQVAKTGDEYERTTKSTAKGTIGKAVDQTINQIKNKVPGLRQTLPIKTDIWGKEVKQEVNLPLRAINNFVNPATVKQVSTDKVDMELNKLYEENHNASILPDILTKTVQLNKQTYRLSNKEYAEFTKNYGQTSHNLIESFIKTGDYNKLTQEQKETAIANIYSYAKEKNKLDYAEKVNEEVKPSTLYSTMKEIEKGGGKQSEYLNYLAKTKGMSKESEKNKVLANSSYSNKTKEIIYRNGTGKDDDLYNNLLSKSNINMTEYLDYKNKVSEKAFSSDKDKNGKTIIGSAKKKVIDYLNNNISGSGNRLLIAGKSYALQNNEKQKLAQYINQIASTKEERLAIYNQLDKNFTVKDGKVYMRVSKK